MTTVVLLATTLTMLACAVRLASGYRATPMRALTPTAAYLQRFSSSLSAKKSTKQPIEEAKTPRKKTSADVDAATKAAVSASKAKAPAQSKSKATKILEEAVSEMKVDTVSSRSIDVEEKKKEKSAVKGNSKKASAESVRKSTAKDASAAKGIQKKGQKDARKTVAKVDKIAESVGGNAPGKSESGKEVETKNNAKADARQEEAEQPSKKKVEFLFPELRVMVKNTQSRIPVDVDAVAKQAHKIKSILKVEDFQLDIWFCSDDKIRDLNEEWRGKRKSTDILSFPANEFEAPEIFAKSELEMFKLAPDEKVLGDLVISPSFVLRQCAKDKAAVEAAASVKPTEVIKSTGSISAKDYVHLDEYGVTKAMSTEFTLEKRIPLLMIHGILHLLEHDHETDEDWKRMVEREEEVLLQFLGKKTTSTNKSKTKSKKVIQR